MTKRFINSSTIGLLVTALLVGACQNKPGVPAQDSTAVSTRAAIKTWDKTFGGTGDDYLHAMVATPDDGFLIGGESRSAASGDKSQNNHGDTDFWIVKVTGDGTKQWDKTFGGNNSELLTSITVTSDGGFLLAGYSDSGVSGDKSQASKGGRDFWIIKLSSDGTKQWDKDFGGTDHDDLLTVLATPDGGFLLGGASRSNTSEDKSQDKRGDPDFWVIKINRDGVRQWDKTFGGTGYESLESIVATSDGGFLLGGTSFSNTSGDKTQDSKGEYDYWIVKISGDGTKQWDKAYGGSGFDSMVSILATSDGGFLLTGHSVSNVSGDKTQANQGGDYWIVKIDAGGTKLWDKTFGGNDLELLSSAIATSDGGFLLTGYSRSTASGDKSQDSKGGMDFWIVKINSDGTKQWDKTFGGSDDDNRPSILATPDGGFLIGGTSFSNASGDKSQDRKGGYDYWIAKIN